MWIVIGIVVLLLVVIIVLASRRGAQKQDQAWPVFPRTVLSNAEQILYHRLVRAFPNNVVLAQVSLARFIGVKKGANFYQVFNRFNRLTVDFALCSKDFRVSAILELDDRSHDRPDRMDADRRKAAVLSAAGIPLHRLNVNPMPGEAELHELLATRS